MSLNAAALRVMMEAGMSSEDIVRVAEALEVSKTPSKGAERTRRWRERRAETETCLLYTSDAADE